MRVIRMRCGSFRTPFFCFVLCFLLYMIKRAWDASEHERHEHERLQRELLAHYHNNNGNISDTLSDAIPLVYYNKEVPLIWIGGVPRSGTTLMRAMLDAHPDVRCGEETRIIPRILGIHQSIAKIDLEMKRLQEAHITEDVLNNALAAYILSIISKHGDPAPRLCNKDPFTLRSMQRIITMFPNSKFLLMLRDGRATVHSIISRKVTIKGFDITSYRGALRDWNKAISNMYSECLNVGSDKCLPVHYEQLVLHPKAQMARILDFLGVEWDDVVLQHEKMIGQEGGVSLSKRELSTDQVNKPVNVGALSKWVGHIPTDVRQEMRQIAPMLETLGYDPDAYPPNYGTPDENVLKASIEINKLEANQAFNPIKNDRLDLKGELYEDPKPEKIEKRRMKKVGLQQRRFKGDET